MTQGKQKDASVPWSGRFEEPVSQLVKRYTASVEFDRRLAHFDIEASLAHARMLHAVAIITASDLADIERGLGQIRGEIESGTFEWSVDREDVHMNIESRLTALVGDAGKRLHTARSRNDQVATDVRLYMRAAIDDIAGLLKSVQRALLELADQHTATIMPGYTHMQVAQPVSYAHHLMAYFEMFSRDLQRLAGCRQRVTRLPLGSAALAGTTFPIDREMVAKALGFDGLCENSLDAVSDRDFAIEFVGACALIMVHLSRFSEDLILYASSEFQFIELSDAVSTGSKPRFS